MILNDWLTQDFFKSIDYLNTNESDNIEFIYAYVRGLFGNKTVSSIVDSCVNAPQTVAKLINLMYSDKWGTVKNALNADIPITGTDINSTETTINTIYGYNDGDVGAKDYKTEKTKTGINSFSDVFEMIRNNVALRNDLAYYRVIAYDCAYVLTTGVYDEGSDETW